MALKMISGNQAAAIAVQRVGVNLVTAYPITPQTAIVEALADFAANGELGGDFVSVESEYAALACCNGAAATGARVFTATGSHGLAYMHEMIHWCSGARLPIVMVNVNRTIGAPWCLDPDQGDSLSQRDTGWLQLYCANGQEVFDSVIQAFILAEKLLLPCMVVFDGFYISHTYEVVDVADEEIVRKLVGPPAFAPQVIPGQPGNLHGLSTGETQLKLVKERHQAMSGVPLLFAQINAAFNEQLGRSYNIVEAMIPPGAKRAVVAVGATAETVRWALPALDHTGLIQLRLFRPFPAAEIREVVREKGFNELLVIDRNCSVGMGGIFAQELRSALYGMKSPPLVRSLILAGGVDLTENMLLDLLQSTGPEENFALRWGDEF